MDRTKENLIALHDGAVDKLTEHRRMMAERATWLDAVAGRRDRAESIARELEQFAGSIRADLGMYATDASGHLVK